MFRRHLAGEEGLEPRLRGDGSQQSMTRSCLDPSCCLPASTTFAPASPPRPFVHTTLIERNWNAMFRRHLAGEEGLEPRLRGDGSQQSMDEIMASIHSWTEEWKAEHSGKPFVELVRIGQAVRAETLALLAELSDEDLASKIPGAPWADGTVGGIMAANADHGRMHYGWAKDDPVAAAT